MRRVASGGSVDSLRASGSLDHTSDHVRENVTAAAAGINLPGFSVPGLPYSMDPGRGTSEFQLALDGDRITGRWQVHAGNVAWKADSVTRKLNTMELLVGRVLTGVNQLDLTADISG